MRVTVKVKNKGSEEYINIDRIMGLDTFDYGRFKLKNDVIYLADYRNNIYKFKKKNIESITIEPYF